MPTQNYTQTEGRRLVVGLKALVLAVVFVWGEAGAADPLTQSNRVVFLPHWIPQAQFAGYYLAAEKGFYRNEGLDVVVLDGGPQRPVDKLLRSGEATIASHFLSAALKLRDGGMPLVHLAQITQRSALMLVAHKSHGIRALKDFEGKKVSVWPAFSAQPQALFRRHNLNVQMITQGATINLFMRGGVDAASAMWYNEYHLFLNSGLTEDDVAVFFYDQNDLNFPEDTLICLEDTWQTNRDVCRKFVKATLAGWQYACDNREEALKVVMARTEQARTGTNRAHQRWMLKCMCELIRPVRPGVSFGELSREDYDRVVEGLKGVDEIKSAPTYDEFHVAPAP
jgi:NitT/TauT family transport system substrate-binding protein